MLIFWLIAVLFILFALWFVLPPLLEKAAADNTDDLRAANVLIYQDQFKEMEADLKNGLVSDGQYQQDKEELERRLLEDINAPGIESSTSSRGTRKFAYGVGIAIPIGVVALYFLIGNPKGLSPSLASAEVASPSTQPGGPMSNQQPMSSQQIAANVEKLAKRLEQNPNDPQGWAMLGRSYTLMERFADAASAYEHATALNANDATVWADYAEVSAMANGQRLAGKPTDAINRALQIDPKNQKALDLAGSAAYQAGDYQKAIDYWQKLLNQLPAGSEELRAISDQIAKAKQEAGEKSSK